MLAQGTIGSVSEEEEGDACSWGPYVEPLLLLAFGKI